MRQAGQRQVDNCTKGARLGQRRGAKRGTWRIGPHIVVAALECIATGRVKFCGAKTYAWSMSALPPKADMYSAMSALCHKRTWRIYSITSSARASSEGGTVKPSALAVFRLIASSNLVGACTGRSLRLAPFEYAIDIRCCLTKLIKIVDTVGNQAAT
jgi:hypothetical protein